MAGQRERFGEQLRIYREAAGYSQEELAERAGLSANAVGSLERSERKRPYPDTIRRLAEALGLSDDDRSAFAAASRAGGSAASEPAVGPGLRARAMGELPGEPTPLLGREREVEVVRQLLQPVEGRLLTLTGPGGVGKTRLALHVARSLVDCFPDGVVWVELAPLGDLALVLPTIAHSLGVNEPIGGNLGDALYAYLRDRRVFLVLDNVEHLLGVAPDMAALLHACPHLIILATSRAPLSIRGEQEYVVPPLELPPAGTGPPLREMEHSPSVALFVQRARQANSTFALTSANALVIAAICRRLDGLPLALELAAARVRALGPTDLLARLDRLLPLLVGGSRDLPQRQQTMWAAISWSHELLSPAETALFRRLAVFAGGWTLEAAEAVGAGGEVAFEEVVDLLSRLVEQSLVTVERNPEGEIRYRMLEPIRQYAAARLAEACEDASWRGRHAMWCLQLAETAETYVPGPEQERWAQRLDPEYGNLRAALEWLDAVNDLETLLRIAGPLFYYWYVRGYLGEARRWLERGADASSPVDSRVRARALVGAAWTAIAQTDHADAIPYLDQSYALSELAEDRIGMALAVFGRGRIAQHQGALDQAEAAYGQALSLFQAAELPIWVANVMVHLGLVVAQRSDHARGKALLHQALALHRESRHRRGAGTALLFLGHVSVLEGDDTRAAEHYHECLDALELPWNIASALEGVAGVEARQGDPERATRFYAAAVAYRDLVGAPLEPAQRPGHDQSIAAIRAELGEARFTGAWEEGASYSVERALAEAAAGLATSDAVRAWSDDAQRTGETGPSSSA